MCLGLSLPTDTRILPKSECRTSNAGFYDARVVLLLALRTQVRVPHISATHLFFNDLHAVLLTDWRVRTHCLHCVAPDWGLLACKSAR